LGLYFQIECAAWATSLGEGEPVDAWLYEEAHRILKAYGNHPSFLLMAYGNEPGKNLAKYTEYLTTWVKFWKQKDSRRLYTTAAGWPAILENQYHNIPETRLQQFSLGLKSRINALPPATQADYSEFVDEAKYPANLRKLQAAESWNCAVGLEARPIISHEVGQWSAYPDFSTIPKYTGFLKTKES